MANAFQDCRQIESTSVSMLQDSNIIASVTRHLGGISYVYVEDKEEQEKFGDVRVYREDGTLRYIELKAEVRHTGNLFIETWSNYSPESEAGIYDKKQWRVPELPTLIKQRDPERFERFRTSSEPGIISRIGWLEKLDNTDVLVYHFLDNNKAYIINWKAFKAWLLEDDGSGAARMSSMWHAPMGKQTFRQKNRSWGLIVKIADLKGRDDILATVDVSQLLQVAA